MRSKMVVKLPANPEAPIDSLLIRQEASWLPGHQPEHDMDVFVLVPGQFVILTEVTLPKLTKKQLLKAIPFALQGILVQPPESYHIVVGQKNGNNRTPVAVVTKAKMSEWMSRLRIFFNKNPMHLHVMLPDVLILPWSDEQWTIYTENDVALVRTGLQAGFVIEINSLWTMLRIYLGSSHIKKPNSIVLNHDISIPEEEQDYFKEQQIQLFAKKLPTTLALMAQDHAEVFPIDLLKDFYRFYYYFVNHLKIYRFIIIGLVGALLLYTWGNLVLLGTLTYQHFYYQSHIKKEYDDLFPGAHEKSIPQMKKRVTNKLGEATYISNTFLRIISKFAESISNNQSLRLISLSYSNRTIIIVFDAVSEAYVNEFIAKLKTQKLNTTIKQNTKSPMPRVTLQIQEG